MNKWAATSLVFLIAFLYAAHGKATAPPPKPPKAPAVVTQRTSKPYDPMDNPNIKRGYTSNLVYWDDVNKVCRRKANKTAPESKMDEILTNQTIVVDPKTVKDVFPKAEICNDTLFNDWSYCAKVMFYGEEGVIEARKYFGKDKKPDKKFANMTEFDNYGFMQDMVLLLIDGCIECKNATEKMEVNLSIVQQLEAGRIHTLCRAERRTYGNTTVTLVNGTANFVFGVVLNERLCPHNKVPGKVPDNINDLVIEELKYIYENLKLVVEHKCMGEQTINIMLPTIDVNINEQMKHAYQLRDLDLDLITLTDGVKLEKGDEMKDLNSGLYFAASIGSGTDKNTTSEPPKPPATAEADPKEKKHEIYDVEIVALEPDV